MSNGKWAKDSGVPHEGWTCIDIEDLGVPDATCEMCEAQEIRYVHHMEHPNYDDTLRCGCICAGHMEQDPVGARQRETAFKNQRKRRANWPHRSGWEVSDNGSGSEFINADGFKVVVYRRGAAWAAGFISNMTGSKRLPEHSYASVNAAKLAAFDLIAEYRESEGYKSAVRLHELSARQWNEAVFQKYVRNGGVVYEED